MRVAVMVATGALVLVGCSSEGSERAGPRAPQTSAPAVSVPDEGTVGHAEPGADASAEELAQHADHLDLTTLPAAKRVEVERILSQREDTALALWEQYAEAITGEEGAALPPALDILDLDELGYVLLTERAYRVAQGVTETGSLETARKLPGVGQDPENVSVMVVEHFGRMCVRVQWARDPFQRSFDAYASVDPGGELQARLERAVAVGGRTQPPCEGVAPAYSPAAAAALEALEGLEEQSGR